MVSCMICLVSSTRESSFWKVYFLFWSIFVENEWKKWCDWWIYREKYIKDVVMVSFLLVITTANRVSFSPVKKVLTYPPMDRVADWVQSILIFFLWRGCFRRFSSIYEEGERIEEPIKKKGSKSTSKEESDKNENHKKKSIKVKKGPKQRNTKAKEGLFFLVKRRLWIVWFLKWILLKYHWHSCYLNEKNLFNDKDVFWLFFYKLQKAICPIIFFSRVVEHETFRFNFYNMKNRCKKWIEKL